MWNLFNNIIFIYLFNNIYLLYINTYNRMILGFVCDYYLGNNK